MDRPPIIYTPGFIQEPNALMTTLQSELAWARRDSTPRSEYYINKINVPYAYKVGIGVREYLPQPTHPEIEALFVKLQEATGNPFEVCFLNRYHNQSDHLGWHSDNSPEMDDERPIAIISLGVEREIWFRRIGNPPPGEKFEVTQLKLGNGSLCLMKPQMQDTHVHRIPKAGFSCLERISLTFRGYVPRP
jgi:alkylated DNA repair dioxygenase AlkB